LELVVLLLDDDVLVVLLLDDDVLVILLLDDDVCQGFSNHVHLRLFLLEELDEQGGWVRVAL